MNCPFLRETRVLGCRSAHVRKLIPRAGGVPPDSVCLNEGHRRCPGFVDISEAAGKPATKCPCLEESLVQYCAAAPVTKFIPYSEAMLVRCGSGAFRYCDLFMDQVGPARGIPAPGEDLPAPDDLLYANQHWWFDIPAEGPWHAGLDAFAARLTGPVDRIGFIPASTGAPPAVVLTVTGREFTFIFPENLPVSASNSQLRLHPERIFDSPYLRGWIYEGSATNEQRATLHTRLAGARDARRQMDDDARMINERLHQIGAESGAALGDGGLFESGLLARLDHDSARALMHELFSGHSTGKRM